METGEIISQIRAKTGSLCEGMDKIEGKFPCDAMRGLSDENGTRAISDYIQHISQIWIALKEAEADYLRIYKEDSGIKGILGVDPAVFDQECHREIPEDIDQLWLAGRDIESATRHLVWTLNRDLTKMMSIWYNDSTVPRPYAHLNKHVERLTEMFKSQEAYVARQTISPGNAVIALGRGTNWPDVEAAQWGLYRIIRKPCCVIRESYGPEAVPFGNYKQIISHPPENLDASIIDQTHPFFNEAIFCQDCRGGLMGNIVYVNASIAGMRGPQERENKAYLSLRDIVEPQSKAFILPKDF